MKILYNIMLLLFMINAYSQKALTKIKISEIEDNIRNSYEGKK